MKLTIKILLVMCLFCSVALADGEMGSGGKTCPPPQTVCIASDGEMGSGGKTAAVKTDGTASLEGEMGSGGRTANDQNQNDSVLTFIQKYLISIFG